MKKTVFSVFCFIVVLLVSCGKETGTNENESSTTLLCITSEATAITQTSAILNGTASIKNAKASDATAYFYYSTTQADAATLKASGQRITAGTIRNTGGEFSANLSSLSPANTYYYVASVSIDNQEELGSVKSFTTENKTDSFSVTGAAIDVTVNSATLTAYANLPADMTGDVTIGIIYSTNSSPSLQNGKLLTSKDLNGNNMYQVEATDLTPDTKYYFKSFLSRSNLNYYGEVKEFTTAQVLASVSTLDAWDVAETKAMVGGKVEISSKGVLSKSAVIYYGNDGTSADALKTKGKKATIEAINEDGSFKTELTSLTASTKYYFIAFVTVEGVEFAGAVKNFTTQDKPTAISITGESTDIWESSAKLYGWSNKEGSEGTSVVFGIEYSATDLTTAAITITASEKDAENKYYCQATNLSSNRLYYYRAFTLFNGVRSYGEVKTFTTLDFNTTVTTLDATEIGEFTAVLHGSVQVDAHDNLSKVGHFIYSDTAKTLEDLTRTGIRVDIVTWDGDGSYKCALKNLKYNTTYYFVAMVRVNDESLVVGSVKTFKTKNIIATTLSADAYYNKAELNGSLSVESPNTHYISEVFIEYGEDEQLSNGYKKYYSSLQDDGSFKVTAYNLKPNTTYYYRSCATVYPNYDLVLGDIKSFKTLAPSTTIPTGAVSLWVFVTKSDGSQYELFWAECNLGAEKPEDYGDYYAWGEIEPYYSSQDPLTWKEGKSRGYYWPLYKWCFGIDDKLTKYCPTDRTSYWDGEGSPDNKEVLDPEDDAAHVNLGGKWRMPTNEEWNEINTQCTWIWTTQNGVNGRLVTGKNGNSIFLPAAGDRYDTDLYGAGSYGYCWSSSLYTNNPRDAWSVCFYSDYVYRSNYGRCYGLSIRPVTE